MGVGMTGEAYSPRIRQGTFAKKLHSRAGASYAAMQHLMAAQRMSAWQRLNRRI
jgi:hypothetical protein